MDEIRVWLAHVPSAPLEWELLDEEERQRAMRYRFEADRARSVVARAALRRLLGEHLHRDPRALRFVCSDAGKPALDNAAIEFNVSHSGDWVAVAIASTPVGVDVERVREIRDVEELASRYFAPAEAARVVEDPSLFFPVWTAKESLIKAVGDGLALGLASFETMPVVSRFTPVVNRKGDPRLDGWFVMSLPAPDGYHCAVCTKDFRSSVRTHRLSY